MGFFTGAIITALVGTGARLIYKSAKEEKEQREEEQRRKNTPCQFNNGISREEFNRVVKKSCKSVKRISKFTTEGPIIHATVLSQSGISEWHFSIDFNDYGKITGKHWITKENADSKIPDKIAERIEEDLKKLT